MKTINKNRHEKGITLIALVITIIVLLILAGISLATLTGDNGVLKQATNASIKTEHASVLEHLQLEVSSYVIDKNTNVNSITLIEYLQSRGIIGDEIGEGSEKYQINVETLTGKTQKYGNGTATESEKNDVYMLEKVDTSTGNLINKKVASTTPIKLATTNDKATYKIIYYGKASEIVGVGNIDDITETVSSTNGEETSNVKWLYQENSDGNIEITGIDLNEYQDDYIFTPDERFDYLSRGTLDVTLDIQTLEVPAQINGKKVVKFEISSLGDYSVLTSSKIRGIKTIIFSDDIEIIYDILEHSGDHLFPDLENVKLPANLKSFGDIFNYSKLKSIEIPNGVTEIGSGAFSGCSSLTNIDIPNGVTEIGYGAFRGCSSLTSIDIPNGVTVIEESAFYGCSSLTNIDIPNSVTEIGFGSFDSTTTVNFPNGKNETLVIPTDKWGAGKITINGIEYTGQ